MKVDWYWLRFYNVLLLKRLLIVWVGVTTVAWSAAVETARSQEAPRASTQQALLDQYCATCHNDSLITGGFSLDSLSVAVSYTHLRAHET